MLNKPKTDRGSFLSRLFTRSALLAGAAVLVPVLLGIFFVLAYQRFSPAAKLRTASLANVTNRPADTATNLAQLVTLRRDLRGKGFPTDDVNLRIWAAHANEPERLFNIPPPEAGKKWNWHLSQDGRCAIAASVQRDTSDRRAVGLYDLAAAKWLWYKPLPWPDAHETPCVFGHTTVLRYTKNARRFAMELNADGQITSFDKLPASSGIRPPAPAPAPQPLFPGAPVASKNGVFFVVDALQQNLIGYAQERLPGLCYAGKGDDNTLFSGNGLLKFTIRDGRVTVSDSLTQTVIQRTDLWPHTTNTVVTGALTTHDGSQINVFLKTDFGGSPSVAREWSVSLALYTGIGMKSFNADTLLAKPQRALHRQALSPDGRWLVSVTAANELVFTSNAEKREVARVSLASLLGLQKPLSHLAFLEEGRHLVLRQGENFWLLDVAVARGYADLLARKEASSKLSPAPDLSAPPATYMSELGAGAHAALALQAEWFADNQAWPYAAALLETARSLQQADERALRVNPLLQARCELLSGQGQKARLTCREALGNLVTDPSEYNHMARFHLQGLLFAKP